MHTVVRYLRSSVGQKQLMGLTGLGWCGFVLVHMAGNILLFVGPQAYNSYSHKLTSTPLIYVAEAGLVVLLLTHIIIAIKLSLENKRARPVGYSSKLNDERATSLPAKLMKHTGVVILVFIVLHLITFKYGPYYKVVYDGVEMRDLHRLVLEVFRSPVYLAGYLLAMVILWFHLAHGFSSSFQSLGINKPISFPTFIQMGYIFATIVAGGFLLQPLYAWYAGGLGS